MAKRRPTPAGELGAADAVCGFAPKFHTEGNRDLVGNSSQWSQSFDMGTNRRKL
jgi:catalase